MFLTLKKFERSGMYHLWKVWSRLESDLSDKDLLLFLDYDGTLTPIADRPRLAKMGETCRKVLSQLSRLDSIKINIISGRSLHEIKNLVGIPDIVYSGNHGLEVEGPKIHYVHPEAREQSKMLARLADKLNAAVRQLKGIFIENKMYTLSIHYRLASEEVTKLARNKISSVLHDQLRSGGLALVEGKKVWELRPPIKWNKGSLERWIMARVIAITGRPHFPIAVGDDWTDEDMFEAVQGKGLGILVANPPEPGTKATYYLNDTREVCKFLEKILEMKKEKSSEGGTKC